MAVPRVVKQNVTIGGVELRQGELVHAADRRRQHRRRPSSPTRSAVDFDRERNRHIAFGAGPHRCLGSHLARMELRVALEEWHRRIPDYAIKPGETPRFTPGIREVRYLPLVWSD